MREKPFNLQGEGVFEVSTSSKSLLGGGLEKWKKKEVSSLGTEPTSVLDTRRSPSSSPPTSSSFAGSDSVDVALVQKKWEWSHAQQQQQQEENSALVAEEDGCGGNREKEVWGSELQPIPTALQVVNGAQKWGLGIEDLGSMLGQEQSLLGWVMGEVQAPSSGFKQLFQSGGGLNFQNSAGFGMVDPGFGFEALGGGGRRGSSASMNLGNVNPSSSFPSNNNYGRMNSISNPSSLPNRGVPFFGSNHNTNSPNPTASSSPNNTVAFYQQQQSEGDEVKPQAFNSTPNQVFFVPLSNNQQDQHLLLPPFPHQLQFLPQSLPNRPTMTTKPEVGEVFHQQVLLDQLFKAAELVETGNSVHARGILARLNHQLTPVGKPLQRAAFLFKEALQLFLLNNNNDGISPPQRTSTTLDVVLKINAYKAFSEVSPLLQFTNFTCNQALLEALERYNSIHIIDFDIGFGGHWASFMQEIRMRTGGIASLKITAFVSPSSHEPLELNLTRENLSHFANELGIPFELNLVSLDTFNPASWSFAINVSESEAVAVNLPVGGPLSHLSSLPLLLRLVKQFAPKIVVSVDRGCDRSGLPFSHYFIYSLQSCSILLESLDAVNVNPDIVHKIEKYFLLPTIERTILGCQPSPSKMSPCKSLFTSAGFSAVPFSNFTETQAEYVLKRLPAKGFNVEKCNASLVLCWERQELASVSAWRC